VYRRTKIVTLSESSRGEIVELLRLPRENITVSPPGIDPRYSPGDARAPHPFVVAVGRLVPVKRFHLLIDVLARLKADHPALEVHIVGEGYERPALEERIAAAGAQDWLRLRGRVSDEELIGLYRRAWALTSTSAREGWGMTVTEAAACGTPAVVTDIAGHADAVAAGDSGLLAATMDDLAAGLDLVLRDEVERARLSRGALAQAERFTWEATARATFGVLAAEARRTRR
jgi:glycosyltransferase involved in cell wall biosynthesis